MSQAISLLRRLAARWGAGPAETQASDEAAGTLDPRLQTCADKICTAEDAVAQIRPGEHVFVGSACATPRTLVAALEARRAAPADVELLHFLTDGAVPHDDAGHAQTHYRHRSFFVGQDMRAAVRQGKADYVPISLARVPRLMQIGRIPVDVALIQVSLPDEFGYVSLGLSVDVIPAAVAQARLVIAEVNPLMPRSMGDSMLHVGEIDHLVPVDTPLIEYQHPAQPSPVVERIARYIGSIIDDGSTLQIGLGRFSNEAMKYLTERQDLGIHSDVITDAIIPLLERGILTGKRKTHQPGKIVASFAMGSKRLYELIDGNPLFSFQPVDAVCDAWTIARQHRMVSVTQAFAIDLSGQACVDQYRGEFYGGVATQIEFLQGASRSEGGKAILCLAATDERDGSSRIRAALLAGEGVGVPRSEVHYVITEYGIAYLFGKSIRERAIALIQIAIPTTAPCCWPRPGPGLCAARAATAPSGRLCGGAGAPDPTEGRPRTAAAPGRCRRWRRGARAVPRYVRTRCLHALLPQDPRPLDGRCAAPVQSQWRDRGGDGGRQRPARGARGGGPCALCAGPVHQLGRNRLHRPPRLAGRRPGRALAAAPGRACTQCRRSRLCRRDPAHE